MLGNMNHRGQLFGVSTLPAKSPEPRSLRYCNALYEIWTAYSRSENFKW